MDEIPSYTGHLLPPEPSTTDLRLACTDYATICRANIIAVADRFEQREDYPFVDTKLDLKTGRDFRTDDPIRGRDAIYGWIQGRGLEALAGHAAWLAQYDDPESQTLAARLRAIAEPVLWTSAMKVDRAPTSRSPTSTRARRSSYPLGR